MKISVFVMAIMVMCICQGRISEEKDLVLGEQRKPSTNTCLFPKGKHGTVLTDGCIQSTCTNGKWKPKMRTDICCYKQQVYKPNTVLDTIVSADNCSTTIECGADAQLEFKPEKCSVPLGPANSGNAKFVDDVSHSLPGCLDCLSKYAPICLPQCFPLNPATCLYCIIDKAPECLEECGFSKLHHQQKGLNVTLQNGKGPADYDSYNQVYIINSFLEEEMVVGEVHKDVCEHHDWFADAGKTATFDRDACLISKITARTEKYGNCISYSSSGTSYDHYAVIRTGQTSCQVVRISY